MTDLVAVADVVCQLNAWEKDRVEDVDFDARLNGFSRASEMVATRDDVSIDVVLPLLNNATFTLLHVSPRQNVELYVEFCVFSPKKWFCATRRPTSSASSLQEPKTARKRAYFLLEPADVQCLQMLGSPLYFEPLFPTTSCRRSKRGSRLQRTYVYVMSASAQTSSAVLSLSFFSM